MRPSDGLPPDPDMLAELETIDATLAGLAIDPAYAEIAELTLLLAAERPRISPEFGAELDARVHRRFADVPAASPSAAAGAPPRIGRARRIGSVLRAPAFGAGVAAVLAATALTVVIVHDSSGPTTGIDRRVPAPRIAPYGAATSKAAAGVSHGAATRASSPSQNLTAVPSLNASVPPTASGATAPGAAAPAPNGRRQVQSAQLQLTSSNARFNTVSQEVFDVVGQESGIVKNSSVTAASGDQSYASFSLSIPSQNLQTTMTRLSELRYATVASRTDATQDVNSQYLNDQRRLADARALRTSLLKQLAAALTQAEIDSITGQIHDAEASIANDEATIAHLQGRINFSSLSVQINAGPVIVHPLRATPKHRGFTLGKAAHDSVRVLTVAAGVALIALAALVPFALLAALIVWIAYWLRRRRREQALDAA